MRINLLPKEERPLKQSQVRWGFLVGLLGFLALAAVLVFAGVENARLQTLTAAHQDALARQTVLQAQVKNVNALRQQITDLEAEEQVYQGVLSGTASAAMVLPAVSDHDLDLLWIEGVICKEESMQIAGYTRDVTSLSSYLNQLQRLGEDAELTHILPLDGTDFQVFAIEVTGVRSDGAAQRD